MKLFSKTKNPLDTKPKSSTGLPPQKMQEKSLKKSLESLDNSKKNVTKKNKFAFFSNKQKDQLKENKEKPFDKVTKNNPITKPITPPSQKIKEDSLKTGAVPLKSSSPQKDEKEKTSLSFNEFKKQVKHKKDKIFLRNNKKLKKDLKLDAEKTEVISKSIPSLNVKKRIKVKGITLTFLIMVFGAIFFSFYVIAVQHSYAIGIGSISNNDNLSTRIFFLFISDFWNKFVMNETYTIYSFFNNISNNINNAFNPAAYIFALSFYISMFFGLIELILASVLLAISLYQKINRNIWIACFSLIPLLGPCLCLYYLGVLHYENTFKYQKWINQDNAQVPQKLDLKEQLEGLKMEMSKQAKTKTATGEPIVVESEKFSYENPIGRKKD